MDLVNVHEIARGTHNVSLLVSSVGSDIKWACTTVYDLCEARKKNSFLHELRDYVSLWGYRGLGSAILILLDVRMKEPWNTFGKEMQGTSIPP